MSRDPGFKFRKIFFLPNPVLNFRKVTKFGEIGQITKNLQAKKLGGRKHPAPSVYRVNHFFCE